MFCLIYFIHIFICTTLFIFFSPEILTLSISLAPSYHSQYVMLLMEEEVPDNVDALPIFETQEWIGVGKKYTLSNIPLHVHFQKEWQLIIPKTYLIHFPAVNLPVTEFIEITLPTQSTEVIMTSTKVWFSKDPPHVNMAGFLTRPTPPKVFLDSLTNSFGQAWLDGSLSIVDQRYNDSRDHLPLWVLAFWQKMAGVVEKQVLWERSCWWLDSEDTKARGKDDISEKIQLARTQLSSLGWDIPMQYQRGMVSSSVVSTLLGTAWLGDEHVDIMMEELAARLALYPELASKVIIAPLAFQIQINHNAKVKTYMKNNSRLLHHYQK